MASAASASAASSSAPATIAAHRSSRSNVSSRPWKVVQTARFSAMTRPKAIGGARRGAAFNEQKARKRTLLQGRSELQTHKDAKLHQRGLEREQRLEKERQRAANLLKGQSYQTVRGGGRQARWAGHGHVHECVCNDAASEKARSARRLTRTFHPPPSADL